MARNILLELEYDGTDFHGWQIQPNLDTIQGQMTRVIERITRERVCVNGSGRTDAGAHALGQVCSFKTESPLPAANFRKAINSLLPPSIRVNRLEDAPEEFHARFDAKLKHYRYRILNTKSCSPFDYRYVHHFPRRLDFERMSLAAETIVGEHDFSSFCDSDAEVESRLRRVSTSFFVFDTQRHLIEYNVCANGFLHHMVRNLVGTLLEVGKGKLKPEDFQTILNSKNRSTAGPTVPAKGLFLVSVRYQL
jgi:tRNA pseudouridine38-40 synthase